MLLSPFTGIAKYTYENSKRLELENSEIFYFYGYFSEKLIEKSVSKGEKKSLLRELKSLVVKNRYVKKFVRITILKLATRLYSKEFDLFWEPNHISNANIKTRYRVTTVHDLSFHLHPAWHPKERVEYFERYFWDEIIKADRIITGSEYSKNELLEYIEYDADKIDVIYHGVDAENFKVYSQLESNTLRDKLTLPSKFILSVGSIEPRKNLLSLLKAYVLLDEQIKQEYKLVLVGFKGWNNSEIMSLIQEEKENVIYAGYLSDLELAYAYNLASLFCYPSYYEGFGIPPLEAMACGTPVITSNVSSLPEVGGDAVLYCDPYDINDIQEKIEMLLSNEKLQDTLSQKGLLRAKLFSWEKAAQKHIEVFNKVLQE